MNFSHEIYQGFIFRLRKGNTDPGQTYVEDWSLIDDGMDSMQVVSSYDSLSIDVHNSIPLSPTSEAHSYHESPCDGQCSSELLDTLMFVP